MLLLFAVGHQIASPRSRVLYFPRGRLLHKMRAICLRRQEGMCCPSLHCSRAFILFIYFFSLHGGYCDEGGRGGGGGLSRVMRVCVMCVTCEIRKISFAFSSSEIEVILG